mmetsp:Transcript_18178/g.40327  ORF Transcript_18178/g.40327 Transcript_18178/m.40327 type:complete len:345 (-) Transcript_18178:1348-2382(-)
MHELLGAVELRRQRDQQALEDVADVADVELVVEVLRGLAEVVHHLSVQRHRTPHQVARHALHLLVELLEVAREEGEVDGVQGHGLGQANGEGGEPALQSGVDLKAARGGVHARHQLRAADVLDRQLGQVVLVLVLQVLAQQGDGGLRIVGVHLGQVDVVHEVHQLGLTRGAVVGARLLHQRDGHGVLQHCRGGVEVEVYVGGQHLCGVEAGQHAVDDLRLARTRGAREHDGSAHVDENLHPEGNGAGFGGGHSDGGHGGGGVVIHHVGGQEGALGPQFEAVGGGVVPVVEDRVLGGHLHGAPLSAPPVAEQLAVVRAVVRDCEGRAHGPNHGEHEGLLHRVRQF